MYNARDGLIASEFPQLRVHVCNSDIVNCR